MIAAVEKLFGPYRWGRYDMLVLPPSFPFGGMENPRLTFATPTVLAGDRSLVSLIAHELAHSWSGNLVTNATWRDFWLNEGFTIYLERRIIEDLYGADRADMEAVLGLAELREELQRPAAKDQILHIDLTGRDPDDGMTRIPYEKGALFLRDARADVRPRDGSTRSSARYFDHFAFQSITTADFRRRTSRTTCSLDPERGRARSTWRPGSTARAFRPASPSRIGAVRRDRSTAAAGWLGGTIATDEIGAGTGRRRNGSASSRRFPRRSRASGWPSSTRRST